MHAIDSDPCNFGVLLRELRMARGLSIYALAEQLDLTPSELGEWELGLAKPTGEQSQALHAVLVRDHMTAASVYRRKVDRVALARDIIVAPGTDATLRDTKYWLNQARLLSDVGHDMAAAASQMSQAEALGKLSDITGVFELISICAKHVAASLRTSGA